MLECYYISNLMSDFPLLIAHCRWWGIRLLMSHSFRLTAAEVDSHQIPMMERAPFKTPAATFGSFPVAPGYQSVIEKVFCCKFFFVVD